MKGHFNKGVARGRIKEVTFRKTRENERPYAELRILCHSREYGDVLVYGRLWGPKRLEDLQKEYKKNPEQRYKFTGTFNQFRDRGNVLSGYNFFNYVPISDDEEPRTSFILSGVLRGKSFDTGNDELTGLNIGVVQKREDKEEETVFLVYAKAMAAERMKAGDRVHVNGRIVDIDAEFDSSGNVIPMVFKFRVLKEKDPLG